MNAQVELREAYEQLADSAPNRSVLTLPSAARPGRGRRRHVRGALVACAVVLIAVVPFVLVRTHHRDAGPQLGSPSPAPATSAGASFWFTSASMPSFRMSQQIFTFADGQSAVYEGEAGQARRQVMVAGIVSSPSTDARLAKGEVVRVGAHRAFYTKAYARPRGLVHQAAVAWKFTGSKWLVMSAMRSSGSAPNGLLPDLPRAELLRLATAFRPIPDVNVAPAKVGYLPKDFRFTGESAYLDQGTMLSPDGMVGTGYRNMSFSTGGAESTRAPSIDITAVYEPASLSSAASLPTFEHGPWTRTKLRGYVAWTDPHTVLVQWGPVQIGVSSSRITGSNTPLVGLAELLKVARSLTVPATVLPGHGYPLEVAVPAGHLQ